VQQHLSRSHGRLQLRDDKSTTTVLFGLHELGSLWSGIATVPIFLWELSLAVWLVVKGFNPAPVLADPVPQAGPRTSALAQ
jgi:hypothetical protein